MKKEITLGQALSMFFSLLVMIVGWGVSVEVRLSTLKLEIDNIIEMKTLVKEIHEQVIRHDERINSGLPNIVTRGGTASKTNNHAN